MSGAAPVREKTPFRRFVADFAVSRMAVLGLAGIALIAVTAWRMVAVDSASSPTAKPKQSTRWTIGKWNVCARSTKRVILRDAAAPQAPPPYSGSPAMIATGIVEASKNLSLSVPLVVRLEGTNVELGKKILAESGLAIIPADNLADAAQKVVAAVKGA